jgi:5-methyltetrahydropteroyltriglutamate--homocysteine methyltransferase
MLTVSKDHPLLTTITGSLPRPHWFTANLHGRPFALAMSDFAFREQYNDAVAAFLCDQTRAGLDLLTDGDARCDCDVAGRSWFGYAPERLSGLEGHYLGRGRTASSRDKAAGDIMYEVLETRVLPKVTREVSRGPLEYAQVSKVAQRQTRKTVKFGAISAQMLATGVHDA